MGSSRSSSCRGSDNVQCAGGCWIKKQDDSGWVEYRVHVQSYDDCNHNRITAGAIVVVSVVVTIWLGTSQNEQRERERYE